MAFGGRGGDYEDEPFLVPRTYTLPELPWEHIAGQLEPITISILRFDARLEASGLAAGWQSRCDMTEAARSLLLDGQLVDMDLSQQFVSEFQLLCPESQLRRSWCSRAGILIAL